MAQVGSLHKQSIRAADVLALAATQLAATAEILAICAQLEDAGSLAGDALRARTLATFTAQLAGATRAHAAAIALPLPAKGGAR